MLGANFVAFFTVQGFFIGIVFGLLKSDSASGLLLFTSLIALFFYLFSHVIVSFYFRTLHIKTGHFSKDRHEIDLDKIVYEINKREKMIDAVPQTTSLKDVG